MTSIQEDEPMKKRQRCLSSSEELGDNNQNQGGGENENDDSLLIIGKDCLTCVAAYLHPRELFQSERICKAFQAVAEPLIENLIVKMKLDCDRLPNGEESNRTKLIRYISAMDLAKTVRAGLSSHLLKPTIKGIRRCYKPECNGCNNFQVTNPNRHQAGHGETANQVYNYFLYIFDDTDHEAPIKYQGFLPEVEIDAFGQDNVDLNHGMSMAKWPKMAKLLENPISDLDRLNEVFVSNLSVVILSVDKGSNNAAIWGACQDYSGRNVLDNTCPYLMKYPKLNINSNDVHSVFLAGMFNFTNTIFFVLSRERIKMTISRKYL